MKKMMAAVLAFVLLLTTIPAMAADNVRTSGDFQYTIKGNGTATIVGYTGISKDIIMPNLIDGYPITSIGDETFDSIKYQSFMTGINVTIPDTITSIGEKAFFEVNLRSINIPDSVEYIGYGAFAGSEECEFRISNNHPFFAVIDGALYNKANKELLCGYEYAVIPEGIVSIGDYACYGGTLCGISSKGISLPSTIKRIGNYAYANGSYMADRNVIHQFPEGLTYIGDYAFADSTFYTLEMEFPDSLEYIGKHAFHLGYGSARFKFSPKTNLSRIEEYAFFNTSESIEKNHRHSIYLDGKIEEYGEYAFSGSHIYGLLNEVKAIDDYAFFECDFDLNTRKQGLVVPASCRTIGKWAFAHCENVGAIIFENGVESIGNKAFNFVKADDWRTLEQKDTYLPTSLNSIAVDAFAYTATFVVEKNSYAERWSRDNAFPYTINGEEEQNLDWLNN